MKRLFQISIVTAAALLALSGCRTRIVSTPEQAGRVALQVRQEEPEPTPPVPTPETTPEPTPPAPTPETTPEPTPPAPTPETTPEPTPPAPTPEATPEPTPPPPPSAPPPQETPPEEAEPERAEEAELSLPEAVTAVDSLGPTELEAEYTAGITVVYDGNGGEPAAQSTVVRTGESYGVQPQVLRRGYTLDGWWTEAAGGERVTADTPVTAETDHTLYAHWVEREGSTVTLDGNGGRVKSREARFTVSDGDAYGQLPVPLREGYAFLGWFTGPEEGEEITPESVYTGWEDVTLYAHWSYDPVAFWTFTLQNRTQQVYLCQQVSFYFEQAEAGQTQAWCGLISDTGSLNIAENRADSTVTDDWVLSKKPQAVLKAVPSLADAAAVARDLAARFPEQVIVLAAPEALGGGAAGLCARLALAKRFYGDWYTDVDLSAVASELGVPSIPVWIAG